MHKKWKKCAFSIFLRIFFEGRFSLIISHFVGILSVVRENGALSTVKNSLSRYIFLLKYGCFRHYSLSAIKTLVEKSVGEIPITDSL